MNKFLQQIENWIGGGSGGPKRVRTFRWLLLLGLVGLMLMILNSFMDVKELDTPSLGHAPPPELTSEALSRSDKESSPFLEYERNYENRLKELLENVVGVSGIDVFVTIDSTEEMVVYTNERKTEKVTNETDRDNAKRHITEMSREGEIILYEASGGERPVVIKTIKPKVRGVIVVASGAENPTVRSLILDAVRKGLDVSSHKVSIVPRKQN